VAARRVTLNAGRVRHQTTDVHFVACEFNKVNMDVDILNHVTHAPLPYRWNGWVWRALMG
jgi:hypothetical protein